MNALMKQISANISFMIVKIINSLDLNGFFLIIKIWKVMNIIKINGNCKQGRLISDA